MVTGVQTCALPICDIMSTFSERMNKAMDFNNITQSELCRMTGIPKSAISQYLSGSFKPKQDRLLLIANALDVSEAWLLGIDVPEDKNNFRSYLGVLPIPKTVKKPRLGAIACGEPILAQENIEDYDDVPEDIKCDFTLLCKGDSMINARINDGDIVYIRQQDTVENGEIAAVLIEDEATLKRVFKYDDKLVLQPENSKYEPFIYIKEEMNKVRIIGKAVGFTSKL